MKIMLRVSVAAAAVVGALGLASCSPGDLIDKAVGSAVEKGIESATGAEIDTDKGEISYKTDDGDEVNISVAGGSLPEGYPEALAPVIDGTIKSSARVAGEDGDSYLVSVVAPGTVDEVFAQVRERLEGAGLVLDQEIDMGEMKGGIFKSADESDTVSVNVINWDDGEASADYMVMGNG